MLKFEFGHSFADILQFLHDFLRVASLCLSKSAYLVGDDIEFVVETDFSLVEVNLMVMRSD